MRSISILWLGSILGAASIFITQVILARELGPEYFGAFSAALAIVVLMASVASFGIGNFWLKVFGEEGKSAFRWIDSSISYVLISTAIVFISILCWAQFGPNEFMMRNLLFILSFYLFGQVLLELVGSRFQLEERFLALTLWNFLPSFLRLLLVIFIIFFMSNVIPQDIAYIFVFVSLCISLVSFFLIRDLITGNIDLKGHEKSCSLYYDGFERRNIIHVLEKSWPFGLGGIVYLVYFQSDIILLKYISGDSDVGFYNVAVMIMAAVYMFPNVVYLKYLQPKIHRWASHDKEKFYLVYFKGNYLMLFFGVLSMVVILLVGPFLIESFFGLTYEDSINVLLILVLAAPARFLISSVGAIMTTQSHLKNKFYIVLFAAILNIILNLIFIPEYGAIGAAATTVATEFILAFIMQMYVRKFIFKN